MQEKLFYNFSLLICIGTREAGVNTLGQKALKDGKSMLLSGRVSGVSYHPINDFVGKLNQRI